jgi:Tfp pilus assembly protein PilO
MTKSSKRSGKPRGLAVTVLAVAGVVGYVMLVFLPAQKALNNKRRELQDKKQFIAGSNVKQAQAAQLEQQLKSARSHVDRWYEQAETAGSPVVMSGEIAALAKSAGVVLHRVTPQEPLTFETFGQQTFAVEVEGTYSQVFEFLMTGIESRPETIWVPKLDLGTSKEDGLSVQCALDIAIFADNRRNSG